MLERVKNFTTLVGLSALLVAGSAAFFSVFGLSKLFSGAQLSVIIMAGSLEFTKLIAASFLYQYWYRASKLLKIYLGIGVVTLVLITSAGIFGYLSNAYQGATIDFEKQTTTLFYQEDRLTQLEEDKVYLKEELEQAISELPENYRTAKRQLREEYNPKVLELNDMILNIKQEIGDLKVTLVQTGVDVGPAIYLARVFGTDIDTVVKFFIFILIFVFDPMALAMVLAWNTAIGRKTITEEEFKEPIKQQATGTWEKIKVEEPAIKTKVKKEWKKPDMKKGGIRG
jgi:cell division protein FtsL